MNRGFSVGVLATAVLIGCGGGGEDAFFGSETSSASQGSGDASGNLEGSSGGSETGSASTGSGLTEGPEDSTGAEGGVKFDLSGGLDVPGTCACGAQDFSYVWVANSSEGSVSQIDTETLMEVGRFKTYPSGWPSPSRTSVSIDGRAAVIANREIPSVVKVWANDADCDPMTNGVAGLQTSTGKNDVKSFGQDDCVAWKTDFQGKNVMRPVAWTSGDLNPRTCEYENQKVWAVAGVCDGGGATVYRLNGDTGAIEEQIDLTDAEFPCSWIPAYGGAVDTSGNFFFHNHVTGKLGRVDNQTLDVTIWDGDPGYGTTVDTKGRVWFSGFGMSRFDPQTETWDHPPDPDLSGNAGIGEDSQGRMWFSWDEGVYSVDRETMQTLEVVNLGNTSEIKGLSVDIHDYVWAVVRDDIAYRYDPQTQDIQFYDGLDGPYTYSDMTGGQINAVTCNPEG